MSELDRFQPRKSFAGVLQPGDCTRYEMVVVEESSSRNGRTVSWYMEGGNERCIRRYNHK